MVHKILTMSDSVNKIDPFLPHLTNKERFFFSYGKEIPNVFFDKYSFWGGGAYAQQIQELGLLKNLCSPGVDWLSSLDTAVTGRTIHSGSLADLSAYADQPLWIKPSEAKVGVLPANSYLPTEVREIFELNNLSPTISLQWTETHVNLNYEHRFFVKDNEVLTGSTYLVDGKVFNKNIDRSKELDAQQFTQEVINAFPAIMPPAFVLDVGLDMTNNTWIVIEANRAWSSGLYGANPHIALEAIHASCNYDGEEWKWVPDSHLIEMNKFREPLKIYPMKYDSSYFFEYKPLS